MRKSLVLLAIFIVLGTASKSTTKFVILDDFPETELKEEDDIIQVHFIPHTHDDVGWLKTVDQYYYGANNTIEHAGVQYILDSVIYELQVNPDRKFIYVESAFFERWWAEQNDFTRQIVRNLVSSGRLEFINGGWCMNDESTIWYSDMINQMTLGHQFLFNEFGIRPKIGWHIDPFGHTNSHPALMARMGFEGFFMYRIDYQDHALRMNTSNLEFIWRGVRSYGNTADMFTGVLYTGYLSPNGLCFQCDNVQPIQDDPRLEDMNIQGIAENFVLQMQQRASISRTNHIMVLLGGDFQYENANVMFKNLDKLIKYVNANNYGVNVFYSTPSLYVEAINAIGATYELTTTDFEPYADRPYCYWTGYFVSRSALKGYVRTRSALLHTVNEYFTLSQLADNVTGHLEDIDTFSRAMGVAQHHDAVSGTERQAVADDYAKRLSIGTEAGYRVLIDSVNYITGNTLNLSYCLYLNESICPALTFTCDNCEGLGVPVILINPIAWNRTEIITLPVSTNAIQVIDSNGNVIPFTILPTEDNFTVSFQVELPPLGINSYFIAASDAPQTHVTSDDYTMENEQILLLFDPQTNLLASIVDKETAEVIKLQQNFFWYNASAGNNINSTQPSGAYIFRPNSTEKFVVNETPTFEHFSGELVQEVRQTFSPWLKQVIRLYNNTNVVQLETTIEPLPIDDGLGKELITQFTTDLETNSMWYTDANGMEYQQRTRNYRSTWPLNITDVVSGNYVPINIGAYIQDIDRDLQLTIMTDRSQGCSSLNDGQLEIMIQRRLLYDDNRGLNEALNETVTVKLTHYLFVSRASKASKEYRPLQQTVTNPLQILFGEMSAVSDWTMMNSMKYQPLQNALPENVRLETLSTLPDGLVLLRLLHIYSIDEDAEMATNVTVDLSTLFIDLIPVEVNEMSLTANQPVDDVKQLKWNISNDKAPIKEETPQTKIGDFEVVLSPMEIKTFLIRFQQRL